jgi:hypothetical protein
VTHSVPIPISLHSLIPYTPIPIIPHPSTATSSSSSVPGSFSPGQQTPLHRGCSEWASPVEACVS